MYKSTVSHFTFNVRERGIDSGRMVLISLFFFVLLRRFFKNHLLDLSASTTHINARLEIKELV